ncbi:MAG: ubiquitin-like domain-containing protein [Promethearchaeota archaeon]
MNFDEEEEFDEDLEEKTPEPAMRSKTPAVSAGGEKLSLFFLSTVGPGEKRQKLSVDNGNLVGDIKQTVGNIFGLDPSDFHLSAGGVTMDDSQPLSNYNVRDGDEILLIPASTAGRS